MKILVLGADGMAGHMISQYLRESNPLWQVGSWKKNDFWIGEDNSWKGKISHYDSTNKLDYIINCIGILKEANKKPVLGVRINSLFPHELAELASSLKIKVIHLSTDCWNDLDTYGRSKRAGELDYDEHLTLRTSIIGPELNPEGTGLFHWFMNQQLEVNGFADHYWDGVTTLKLAKGIEDIIKNNSSLNHIINFRSKGKISKYELLKNIGEVFNREIIINKTQTEVVDKSCPNAEISIEMSLKDQIIELKTWMESHREEYVQYGI